MPGVDIPAFDERRIRDPVHGLIVFDGSNKHDDTDRIAWALLNTPEMQRLRRIKQLGFSELVYPGACHTRFAHSVGAYHLARRLVRVIQQRTDRENKGRERAARLAALLHDIGHGPFSHAFEHVTKFAKQPRDHEDWSVAIVKGDSEVRRILDKVDANLAQDIATMISAEEAEDIYATVVSSQFDCDRLDYIQRDRIMTGVQFGHIDADWIFDCLRVGEVNIERGEGTAGPEACLFINYKGVRVADEYLEARFRLYANVYMHKTTRAAEKILEAAMRRAALNVRNVKNGQNSRLMRFFRSRTPSLGDYLALDDSVVWAELGSWRHERDPVVAQLAERILDRNLYKCFDLGPMLDRASAPDQLAAFRKKVQVRFPQDDSKVPSFLEDNDKVTGYKWYEFDDRRALKKVFVQRTKGDQFPVDIGAPGVSAIVETLRAQEAIHRFYVPEKSTVNELEIIWRSIRR